MSDDENLLFEVSKADSDYEESIPSSEEETAPEPEPIEEVNEPEPKDESVPVKRTKTGRIKKKASPKTRERLRKQLAAGRAKSLEIRRRNKKLKEIEKRKKLDEEDKRLLEELQDRKTNQELRDEIKKLRESMKTKEPEVQEKQSIELPPKPQKKNTVALTNEELPPVVKRRIKSHLPYGHLFFQKK